MAAANFQRLPELDPEQVSDAYSRRSLIGDRCMLSWAEMKAGTHARMHRHPQEQFFWILSGEIEFTVGDRVQRCHEDDLVHIPSNLEHEALCIADTRFLTVLSPLRTDLLPGAPLPDHLA